MNVHSDLFENILCDLCGSNTCHVVYPPRHDAEVYSQLVDKFKSSGDERLMDQLVQCGRCGLLYVNPRLRTDLILKAYAEGKDERFVSQASAREKTFARALTLLNRFWGPGPRGKLLDVGTAGGSFLYVARQNGWEVYGCELNRWLCDWGKKQYDIAIQAGGIFDLNCADDFFDVVTLWDVLEHTPSPKRVLEECQRILRPGGLVLVNYPDIGSWIARAMKKRWVFLLSVHLYYFTRKTISKLLSQSGFSILKMRPHFQTLEVGYIFQRMQAYLPRLGALGKSLAHKMKCSRQPIPYWMGQTLVVARKV